jgi:putative GTP pyrophosphokinase
LKREYDTKSPLYNQLIEEVCYIINRNLKARGIKISTVEFRLKDFNSVYDKVLRKEYSQDIFEKMEDIAGVRIICLYRSDLPKIEEIIRKKFRIISSKIWHNEPNLVFGYMSDHYIVKLPARFSGERYDAIKELKCEVQIRTISMHAWATVSHQLDYKQEIDIPSELKNDLKALSGVFYVADSLFEQFQFARKKTIDNLKKSATQKEFSFEKEINFDSVHAYLSWKFPNRKLGSAEAISSLISELFEKKVKGLQEVDQLVDANMKWLLEREKTTPNLIKESGKRIAYAAVGVVRVIIREKLKKEK